MFLTNRDAEQTLLSSLHPGMQAWSVVQLQLQVPYFQVGCDKFVKAEGQRVSSIFLAFYARDLEYMIKAQSDDFRIQYVMVNSPPHVNGTDSWKLERLEGLFGVSWEEDERHRTGLRYEVTGGQFYEHLLGAHSVQTKVDRILYSEERDLAKEFQI